LNNSSAEYQQNLQNKADFPALGDGINYNIKLDCDDDVIVITVGKYKFFMAHGVEGREAKDLYEHLIFTSRMQYGNKNIKATDNYLKKGLEWGEKKLKRAKAFLSNAGLIEYIRARDEKGHFTAHTILIKSMWDEESLTAWLERRATRTDEDIIDIELSENPESEDKPVENSSGADSAPLDNSEKSCPQGQLTTYWTSDPCRPRTQTNKDRERETYKREKEETTREIKPVDNSSLSPPAGGFSEIPEMIRYLEAVVEKDGAGRFFFPPKAKAALEHFSKVRSIRWVQDQYDFFRQKKTTAQIRRFCELDLPKHLSRAHGSSPKKEPDVPVAPRVCPACGAVQPVKGAIAYCPACTLPASEFHDRVKVEEHRQWWEEYQNREAVG